jgi:hypothetical protein
VPATLLLVEESSESDADIDEEVSRGWTGASSDLVAGIRS